MSLSRQDLDRLEERTRGLVLDPRRIEDLHKLFAMARRCLELEEAVLIKDAALEMTKAYLDGPGISRLVEEALSVPCAPEEKNESTN